MPESSSIKYYLESNQLWTQLCCNFLLYSRSNKFFPLAFFLSFFFFFLFRAAPMAYESSWARGWIGAGSLCHSHSHTRSKLHLQPMLQLAYGNAASFSHWMRPGIEPASLWILCQILNPLSHNRNSSFSLFTLQHYSRDLLTQNIRNVFNLYLSFCQVIWKIF